MEQPTQHRGLYIFESIMFILLGLLAIALPGLMTLGLELFIGWLLIIAGVIQGYRTLVSEKSAGFWYSLFSAILSIVTGVLLLVYPMVGMLSLTMLLIVFFLLEGVAKIIYSFYLKPITGWGWVLFSGIIALALGAIIISGWPVTALWAIGLIVGINMLFYGVSLLALAIGMDKGEKI